VAGSRPARPTKIFKMNYIKNGRILTKALRHKPDTLNLKLDKNGYSSVESVLNGFKSIGIDMTFDQLKHIVKTDDKNRLSFNSTFDKIRANQGHSVKVDLNLKSTRPPSKLYHGTVQKHIDSIKNEGLRKMNRHHVHLSKDKQTAIKVGSRKGEPIILEIDSDKMYADDFKFFLSDNGVWLTEFVPPIYILNI
jgi:putative RNA 2'-phosphotransferase